MKHTGRVRSWIYFADFVSRVRSSRINLHGRSAFRIGAARSFDPVRGGLPGGGWNSGSGGPGADFRRSRERARGDAGRMGATLRAIRDDARRRLPVSGGALYGMVAARHAVPAVFESRFVHPEVGGYVLPARPEAATVREVCARD